MPTVPNDASTILGIDPHPSHHTAAALDRNGHVLSTIEIPNDTAGLARLQAWSAGYSARVWAIEGAGNRFAADLVRTLRQRHELIVDVPALVTSQYRSRRTRHKNDALDAICTARAYLANPQLPPFMREQRQEALQELSRTHRRVSQALKAQRMALRAARVASVRAALEHAISALQESLASLEKDLRRRVREQRPELLALPGVGAVLAGVVLAEAGSVARFRSRDAFASFAGCAPVTRQSGRWRKVRVNAGGNRRLNWAVHLVVRCRLGSCERTRAYARRKEAQGKSRREVYRCLKTIVAREIYGVLRATEA